ncbi:MAG: serine/threonine protein kinase [Lentisphaeria bacterium]|nr:serine/threonine protein kinase [Lentisphaeria bacterium]
MATSSTKFDRLSSSAKKKQLTNLLVPAMFFLVILFIFYYYLYKRSEQRIAKRMGSFLTLIIRGEAETLSSWLNDRKALAESLGYSNIVRNAFEQPSEANHNMDELLIHLKNAFNIDEAIFLSPDGEMIFSSVLKPYDINRNVPNLINEMRHGKTRFYVPPVDNNMDLLIATPCVGINSEHLGIVILRINTAKSLAKPLYTTRFGNLGDIFAFNENGILITPAKSHLKVKGNVSLGNGILDYNIFDSKLNPDTGLGPVPKDRLSLPVFPNSVYNVDGYFSYHNNEVIGIWTWIEEYQLGLCVQVEKEEAFEPLSELRSGFHIGVFFIIAITILMVIHDFWLRKVFWRLLSKNKTLSELGNYDLHELVGEGGMGKVYRASHKLIQAETAVKIIDSEKCSRDNLKRFYREVQLCSQLSNPHTIRIYDFNYSNNGILYYAMEYLDGRDLGNMQHHYGIFSANRMIHIIKQVCLSLQEAHDRGMVHRDIKPSNILLCNMGGIYDYVKVLDFGLVKQYEQIDNSSQITQYDKQNMIFGTPQFMSPEAVQAPNEVNACSDIYSLGCVMYYMLTGMFVFEAETSVKMCIEHVKTTPMTPTERSGIPVPDDLTKIIMRCLSKDPKARPASASILFNLLENCQDGKSWSFAHGKAWWMEQTNTLVADDPKNNPLDTERTTEVSE